VVEAEIRHRNLRATADSIATLQPKLGKYYTVTQFSKPYLTPPVLKNIRSAHFGQNFELIQT
jgi:hypothetical protein